jgi:Mg2+-importing ATPase
MLVVAILTVCPPNDSMPTFVLIMLLLGAAIAMRFWEEVRGRALTAVMASADAACAAVLRDGARCQVDIKAVVEGDIVSLSAGDLIPGDMRVLDTSNLFVG